MASSTERSRRCRERERRGVIGMWPVEVTAPVVRRLSADGLISTGNDMSEEELEEQDNQISTALSQIVHAWGEAGGQ